MPSARGLRLTPGHGPPPLLPGNSPHVWHFGGISRQLGLNTKGNTRSGITPVRPARGGLPRESWQQGRLCQGARCGAWVPSPELGAQGPLLTLPTFISSGFSVLAECAWAFLLPWLSPPPPPNTPPLLPFIRALLEFFMSRKVQGSEGLQSRKDMGNDLILHSVPRSLGRWGPESGRGGGGGRHARWWFSRFPL